MKIRPTQQYNINSKAGVNYRILLREAFTNAEKKERLCGQYGIIADFKNNKSVALINDFCINIFENLGKKFGLDITAPPMISVYRPEELIEGEKYLSFCIPDTKTVLKDEPNYPGCSLFFKNYKNIKEIDDIVETLHSKGYASSNHFMAIPIHEWLHSIHLDYIFTKFGYPGECKYLSKVYPSPDGKCKFKSMQELQDKTLSDKETEIIVEELGLGCRKRENQYFEIFSEMYTKLICESLGTNCRDLVKNPFDLLAQKSIEVRKIIEKITNME